MRWLVFVLSLAVLQALAACSWFEDDAEYETTFRKNLPLAQEGNASAQYNIGTMYYEGLGVDDNFDEALTWFRRSADQGYARAQSRLGFIYAYGSKVPRDYTLAVKWFQRAADQGHAKAQYNLGTMYANGLGVPQDYVMAHMWLNLAASRLVDADERNLAADDRDDVADEMPPSQLVEAQRLAAEWTPSVP
jgi:TPR repeat protein